MSWMASRITSSYTYWQACSDQISSCPRYSIQNWTASFRLSAGDSPPKMTESGILSVSVRLSLTNFLIHYTNGFLKLERLMLSCASAS